MIVKQQKWYGIMKAKQTDIKIPAQLWVNFHHMGGVSFSLMGVMIKNPALGLDHHTEW